MVFLGGYISSPAPALQDFCKACMIGVVCDFGMQITLFGSFVVFQLRYDYWRFVLKPGSCNPFNPYVFLGPFFCPARGIERRLKAEHLPLPPKFKVSANGGLALFSKKKKRVKE